MFFGLNSYGVGCEPAPSDIYLYNPMRHHSFSILCVCRFFYAICSFWPIWFGFSEEYWLFRFVIIFADFSQLQIWKLFNKKYVYIRSSNLLHHPIPIWQHFLIRFLHLPIPIPPKTSHKSSLFLSYHFSLTEWIVPSRMRSLRGKQKKRLVGTFWRIVVQPQTVFLQGLPAGHWTRLSMFFAVSTTCILLNGLFSENKKNLLRT